MNNDAKRTIGAVLTVSGALFVLAPFLFPAEAGGLATVIVDTTPPEVFGSNPAGSQSSPSQYSPTQSITLKMGSWKERVNNPRVIVDGAEHSLSFSSTVDTPKGTQYNYTASLSALSTGTTHKFVWKGEDDAGNTGTNTTYAKWQEAANGYFSINGQKLAEGATITISTRSIDIKFHVTTSTQPQNVFYIIKDSAGNTLKSRTETEKTSSPWEWSYTFPSDGTYTVNGYFNNAKGQVKALELNVGVNASPKPPISWPAGQKAVLVMLGVIQMIVGLPIATKPEMV